MGPFFPLALRRPPKGGTKTHLAGYEMHHDDAGNFDDFNFIQPFSLKPGSFQVRCVGAFPQLLVSNP